MKIRLFLIILLINNAARNIFAIILYEFHAYFFLLDVTCLSQHEVAFLLTFKTEKWLCKLTYPLKVYVVTDLYRTEKMALDCLRTITSFHLRLISVILLPLSSHVQFHGCIVLPLTNKCKPGFRKSSSWSPLPICLPLSLIFCTILTYFWFFD